MDEIQIDDSELIKDDDLQMMFKESNVNLREKVNRPPVLISIGLNERPKNGVCYPVKFASRGNISLITGEEKSRKSYVKSLIEASSIGGNSNNYNNDLIKSKIPKDEYVISIDGEQSKYDVWLNGIRIPQMVGTPEQPQYPDNYKSLMWREYSKDQRLALLKWLFMESPIKDKIAFVFLDGYVDFIKDFNNLEESNEFVDLLLKYTSIANCHICGILHLNPGSDKSRGHSGTILQQKSENVVIVKNMGEYSVVKCKDSRGDIKFKSFCIRIDNDWLPYISDDPTEEENKQRPNI